MFRANRVCRKWKNVVAKYGVVDRHEMSCYFSKSRLSDSGCTEPNASGSGVSVVSQMGILSLSSLWFHELIIAVRGLSG